MARCPAYAAENGVSILGDVPMFVAHNSADCWAHQDQFDLDEAGNPSSVAGVPPDYFSADGQLWGNPLYDYQAMARDNYQWWTDRFRRMMDLVDEVRVDHFRGFAAYWAVPAGSETAKSGAWKEGPGLDLFRAVYQKIGRLRLVAEDLGVITDDVCTLKDALHLPGMKVIQFHLKDRADGRLAFDTEPDCIAYTGTHDNNTIRGWYEDDLTPSQQLHVRQMLGLSDEAAPQEIVGALIAIPTAAGPKQSSSHAGPPGPAVVGTHEHAGRRRRQLALAAQRRPDDLRHRPLAGQSVPRKRTMIVGRSS